MQQPGRGTEQLRITPRSAILAVALLGLALLLLRVVAASQRVIGWVLAATAIAGLLQPLVARLARRIPWGAAVAVVAVGTVATLAFVTYSTVDGIAREMRRLERAAPDAAARLERKGRFSELARDIKLAERTEKLVKEAPERLRGGTPAEALRAQATRGVAFLATGVLSLFFLLHGRSIAAGAANQIHDVHRRQRVSAVAVAAFQRGFGYARGTVAMALLAGLVAYAMASWADVPGAAPLALWVALWDVVPYAGAIIGAVPIIVLGAIRDPAEGWLLAIAFIGYQVAEGVLLQRRIERRTVHLGPFLTAAGGFAGLELYGVGGAVMVLLALALLAALADELASPDSAP